MTAGHSDRRPVKIRRKGRHATPSQVEKVAERAGKAAPAVAIAGALVAAPQAQHALAAAGTPATTTAAGATTAGERGSSHQARATLDSVATRTVTVASDSTARHAALAHSTRYLVRGGDSLSSIAQRRYGRAGAWQWLYHENDKKIANPNLIYAGEQLFVPASAPAHYTLTSYQPRHAKATAPAPVSASASGGGDSDDGGSGTAASGSGGSDSGGGASGGGSVVTQSAHGSSGGLSGTLSCSGLEQLWDAAGGNPAHAFIAAEIAMAESGGRQYALSPTEDRGYWQINWSNGALSTYDPYGNAHAAITLSSDGANWDAWTTYRSGAYYNQC